MKWSAVNAVKACQLEPVQVSEMLRQEGDKEENTIEASKNHLWKSETEDELYIRADKDEEKVWKLRCLILSVPIQLQTKPDTMIDNI